MRVRVRLFAGLREAAGRSELDESFDAPTVTVADVYRRIAESHPALVPQLDGIAIAVNQEYVMDRSTEVHDGDEVALIRPIAGGSAGSARESGGHPTGGETPRFLVTPAPLDRAALRDLVRTDASGAIVLFEGVVRDHHDGHGVLRLEYEAYAEMAERQLAAVATEVERDFPSIHRTAAHHRTGMIEIGDISLLVAVSAGHRREAFEAALRFVDRIKETVPVWKKEYTPDGATWQEGIGPVPVRTDTD